MRAGRLAGLLAAALCAAAAAPYGRPAPRTHTVTIERMRFQPSALSIARGDTVVWVNKDLVPHTATSRAGGFDSGTIAAAASWRHTVRAAGTFRYVCTLHPTMAATLRVE